MISLENLKQLSELQQDFANSEYLAQATSLGSIFDTMMFPDYENTVDIDFGTFPSVSSSTYWSTGTKTFTPSENGFIHIQWYQSDGCRIGDYPQTKLILKRNNKEIFKSNKISVSYTNYFIPVEKGTEVVFMIAYDNYDSTTSGATIFKFIPLKEIE